MALNVYHLNCVEIQSPGNGRAVGHCLLLETDARLLLVDAGIGRKDTEPSVPVFSFHDPKELQLWN